MPTVTLARHADVVILGDVETVRSRWENQRIVTDVTIAVDDSIAGQRKERVTFTAPGGVVDGVAMRVSGGAGFRAGERVAVMLVASGSQLRHLGLSEGKLAVVRSGSRTLVAMRTVRGGRFEAVDARHAMKALRAATRRAR